ncbi:hypothetical protein ABZS71_29585 [Streptomyces sp. NPDC005393]|uniref:hypothetical protein n=1 Tax=Streptomyces sp. NPDC005393 TaxID=3157041 RepID=UPI0033A5AEBB
MVKKAALLTAAAATAVLVGAGGASAYGGTGSGAGTGGFGGFIFQINECDAATGANTQLGGVAPTGDINVGSNCTNLIGG